MTKEEREEAADKAARFFAGIVMAGGSVILFVLIFSSLMAITGFMWKLIQFAWGV